jgi:hypothetical protein
MWLLQLQGARVVTNPSAKAPTAARTAIKAKQKSLRKSATRARTGAAQKFLLSMRRGWAVMNTLDATVLK